MINWFRKTVLRDPAAEAPSGGGGDASGFADVVNAAVELASSETASTPASAASKPPSAVSVPAPSTGTPPAATASIPPATPAAAGVPSSSTPAVAPSPVPAASVPQPAQPAASAPPPGPTQAQQYAMARQAAQNDLAKAYSNFSPEQIQQLITEPHTVLPQMLASAMLDMYDMITRTVYTQLPQIINATSNHSRAEEQAQQQFYGQFPQLKEHPQGYETLMRIGTAYNEANVGRQISPEQRMKEIGNLVCATLGIPVAPVPAATTPQPSATPFLPPHVPTGVGGSAAPPPIADSSPWGDVVDFVRRS